MAFCNARTRDYSSSDDSDAYEDLISRLKSSQRKSSTTSKSSNESLNKFIANDSSDISNESCTSDGKENMSDDLGLHIRLNNKFDQMSFNERTPLKCLIQNKPSTTDADPTQASNKITIQDVSPKKNDIIKTKQTIVKPVSKGKVFSTRIVFSSSDEEVFIPTKPKTFDDKIQPTTSSVKSSKVLTEKENMPVIELSSDESDFEIFPTTPGLIKPKLPAHSERKFTFALKDNTNQNFLNDSDFYRPLVHRINETVDGKRGNSLGEGFATPPINTWTKPAPMTEVVHKVTSRLKPRDGLPENLPPKCNIGKHFKTHRGEVTQTLFKYFNETVFENKLDANMEVDWSKRLLKTAGTTKNRRRTTTKIIGGKKMMETSYSSTIALSEKVIDNLPRLRDTLIHEMCHAAVWVISKVNEGHGPYWKWWAQKAMKQFPDLPVIKRCHSYDISYKFYYQCTLCKQTIGRHSKSINTEKSCCGVCKGKIVLLPSKKGDTPRTPNKFALFVKENYNTYKNKETRNGCETPKHGEIMKGLSREFSKMKTS